MTDQPPLGLAKRAGRAALGPVTSRLDMVRRDLDHVQTTQRDLAAAVEQATAATTRLEAYFDRFREEIRAEFGSAVEAIAGLRSLQSELDPGGDPDQLGTALRLRFDHALLHAEAKAVESRRHFERELGLARNSTNLTHALVERALAATSSPPTSSATAADGGGGASVAPVAAPNTEPRSDAASFSHVVPTFDVLYRAFEDRHRGDQETITDLQANDYLDLLQDLPNPELPVADLGCGRGELVRLLANAGLTAVGVDSNQGQVVEGDAAHFVEDDLFRWLDRQEDGSHRAVLAMHVIEHLPLDLQIRLVFEARRVLAPGGLLVLETPNALSLSTAATNFWVDPTHQRPVHPAFMEFLAIEAGFGGIELRPLHPLGVAFRGSDEAPELAADLNSMILGSGDMAMLARR